MTTPTDPTYSLTDPRPIAAGARYTFFLPNADELAAVAKGDLVKLVFEYHHEIEEWSAERMWVIVESADGDDLRGVLDNDPDEPTSPLTLGDTIHFQRHNVIAIRWADAETAPPPSNEREYWERCLVDQCVLDGEAPVEYLYREAPDMAQEGDSYPDSGWRIRGRMDGATDAEMEAREIAYVALGAVLNRDDSWIAWIDAPVGTRLFRDFETGEYVRQD